MALPLSFVGTIFFISSHFLCSAVHCGTPLCRTLSSLCRCSVGCLLCAGGNGECPGVACSLNGAVKAMERGEQEFDRLKQFWGKSLPKDCFSSRFTEQSRRRMRGRRGSENTQVAASGSLMKEWSKGSCSLWQPVCLGSLCAAGLSCFVLCT